MYYLKMIFGTANPVNPPPLDKFVDFVHVFNMLNMNKIDDAAAALGLVNVSTNLSLFSTALLCTN